MCKPLSYAVTGVLLMFTVAVSNVHAAATDISLPAGFGQPNFDKFVDELGSAIAYNPLSPAEPLGLTGFEIGASFSLVAIDPAIWDGIVADGAAPSYLPVPRISIRKGLPMGFGVGFSRITVPSSNVTVTGLELRKAILDGSMATPAVSVLLHTSKLSGVDDLDISSYGVDLGISKGFLMFTPYAGVGQVWVKGSENVTFLDLTDRESSKTRYYVGVRMSFLPFISMTVQADIAETTSYTLRLNIGF